MADLLYFTELLGLKVYDLKGRRIGRVEDAALVPLVDPVRVDRYLIRAGWAWLTVRHDQVQSLSLDGIHLRDELLTPYHDDEYMLRIARDLLDQQIIDVNGRKAVRVTDVTFELINHSGGDVLRVLEVDVGLRSIVRRILQGWVRRRWIRRLQAPVRPNSIRWEFCNIVEPDPQRRLRLNIDYRKLENLHPADLADIVEDLSPEERSAVIETLDSRNGGRRALGGRSQDADQHPGIPGRRNGRRYRRGNGAGRGRRRAGGTRRRDLRGDPPGNGGRAQERGHRTARVRGRHRRRPDEYRVRGPGRGRHRYRRRGGGPRQRGPARGAEHDLPDRPGRDG